MLLGTMVVLVSFPKFQTFGFSHEHPSLAAFGYFYFTCEYTSIWFSNGRFIFFFYFYITNHCISDLLGSNSSNDKNIIK